MTLRSTGRHYDPDVELSMLMIGIRCDQLDQLPVLPNKVLLWPRCTDRRSYRRIRHLQQAVAQHWHWATGLRTRSLRGQNVLIKVKPL